MNVTTNLQLNKPGYDEVADIEVINGNMDILDEQFDGSHLVTSVNSNKPVNGNVIVDVGVTSVNGKVGAVTILQRTVKELVDILYPVGCYFDTTDKTFNPNTAWGGTWEKVVDGRVLIAGGGNYNVGSNYGESTHTLTVQELPTHSHSVSVSESGEHTHQMNSRYRAEYGNGGFGDGFQPYTYYWGGGYSPMSTSGNHTHNVSIGNTGSNIPFNVVQPSTAVARWHRIA